MRQYTTKGTSEEIDQIKKKRDKADLYKLEVALRNQQFKQMDGLAIVWRNQECFCVALYATLACAGIILIFNVGLVKAVHLSLAILRLEPRTRDFSQCPSRHLC